MTIAWYGISARPGMGNLDPFTRSDGTIVSFANEIRGGILANEFGLPSGNFASTHVLVTEGYYTAGASYPDYFQDAADNTMILGDYKIGAQMSKIYIPPIGGLGGTADPNHRRQENRLEHTARSAGCR